MKIDGIIAEWSNRVEMKNSYQFGYVIDMEDFQSLLKTTFNWVRKIKNDIINNQSSAADIFNYAEVVSVMSRYIPDTCAEDESEEKIFTATCLLVSALVDFCIDSSQDCIGNSSEIIFLPEIGEPLSYSFDDEDYSAFLNYNEDDFIEFAEEDCEETDFE